MKNVSRPIRFPEVLRETVILANINPAVLLQQHINSVCFFTIFSNQETKSRLAEAERICVSMMTTYQASGKVWQDTVLWNLNKGYLSKLIVITPVHQLHPQEKYKSPFQRKPFRRKNTWELAEIYSLSDFRYP